MTTARLYAEMTKAAYPMGFEGRSIDWLEWLWTAQVGDEHMNVYDALIKWFKANRMPPKPTQIVEMLNKESEIDMSKYWN